jgi:pilus assembly protein CpaB
MKPKTLILMIVAVSCGLGASYMTSRLLADRQGEVEKVSILVAKKTLSMGDMIKIPEDMFDEKLFAKGEEPKQALVEFEKVKGRQLKRSLRPGDFVTVDDLVDEKTSIGVQFNLPPNHQAIGIRVNPESIAGGFASLPNSRVNIISTVQRRNNQQSYSKILLENVLVLAADAQTRVDETGRAMPANVVTVAVKPEDVLKIELAKSLGTLSLALRKFGDASKSPVGIVNELQLGNTGTDPVPVAEHPDTSGATVGSVPVPPKEPPVPTPTVAKEPAPTGTAGSTLVINGTERTVVPYVLQDSNPSTPPPTPAPKKNDEGN